MKIYLAIFLSLLISPLAVWAAATSISFGSTSYVQLTVGGVTRTFEVSGTGVESITVNESSGNFTLDFATGAMTGATIVSTDRLDIAVTPATISRSNTCGVSNNTVVIPHGSGEAAATATLTPASTTCIGSSGTGGGGGSAGGGGGGGGISYIYTPPTPAPTPTITPTVTPVAPTVAMPSPVAQVASPVFNNDLVRGQSNDDVKRLQELLAGDKELYPEGLMTGLFGPATERAVKRFQAKYGLPQVGRVGPMTRAKLAEVFAEGVPAAPTVAELPAVSGVEPSPVAQAASPVFNSDLQRGSQSDDVKRLQQLLGVTDTGFFGSLTESAVRKFQGDNGLPQVGRVGPATRAKLQEVFSGTAPQSVPAPTQTPSENSAPSVSPAAEEAQKAALQQQLNDLQRQLNAMLNQLQPQ